jgi:glycosyltransferase involved in cell wall biosynthesis
VKPEVGTSADSARGGISVVMSAFNEEAVIRGCLESVKGWADEIVVVNGSSQDRTAAIAQEYTNRVLLATNKLMLNVNKNLAIEAATREWVLLLDPDEQVSGELARELQAVAEAGAAQPAGYWVRRRNFELGRWMGSADWQLRFFRNGQARFPCRHMHEIVAVDGPVGRLAGHLVHLPRQRLADHVHKRNLNSEHWAVFLYERGIRFRLYKLLLWPFRTFVEHYLLRGRWREGIPGLIYGVNEAYCTFLQHAKLWQKWQEGTAIRHTDPLDAFFSAPTASGTLQDEAGPARSPAEPDR